MVEARLRVQSPVRSRHNDRLPPLPLLFDTALGVWRNIQVPILILVGEKSNVLPLELTREMQRQNSRARCLKVSDVGHMPMLMQLDQIDPVVQFPDGGMGEGLD
jgi:pimeloyl-ACP methyl ester carboxylesterase